MTTKILIVIICLIVMSDVFIACNQSVKIENSISGIYVRVVENEFSRGEDTLTINEFNGKVFKINHDGSFQRIINGSFLPSKTFHEKWTAIFDEKDKTLKELKRGKVLSFKPSRHLLLVGASVYKKIK